MFKTGLASAFLLILTFLVACSSGPGVEIPEDIKLLENLTVISPDSGPSYTVEFNEEVIYGDTEDVILGGISGVAVDNSGRVFIADGDQNFIHAYESDGSYHTRVGNEGEGPGEFSNIGSLKPDDQYLYAYDYNKRRLNVFLLESLNFSHTIPLLREDRNVEELSGTYPGGYFLRNDGKLLVSFNQPFGVKETEEKRTTLYYLMDGKGKIVSDKFFEQKVDDFIINRENNSVMVMSSPFGRKSLFTVADDDRIYTAWTEDFLIKIHNPDGSYEQAFYYPYSRSELEKDEVVKEYEGEQWRKMIRNADAPSTWPALNSFSVDDKSRIWVSTITDDKETYDWWLLSEEGELLARFTWPRNRSLVKVQNGNVYTRETDEETGLQQVVRYNTELL